MTNTSDDTVTMTLPGVEPVPAPKAKPGQPRKYSSNAEKQAAYRAKKGVKNLTIALPAELHAEFTAWLSANDKGASAVIARVIRTQVLRKR